ncbi:MAG: hypothetical protein JW863_10915 [Chitinispirillaceae bacterium]|nr:hypothetical protein [Chitinispirillaceae bacterium]
MFNSTVIKPAGDQPAKWKKPDSHRVRMSPMCAPGESRRGAGFWWGDNDSTGFFFCPAGYS